MKYSVKYKKIGSIFWKTLKNIVGDGFVFTPNTPPDLNMRWFILEDESRIEISTPGMIFKFSKERYYVIKKTMEKEAGQKIVTD